MKVRFRKSTVWHQEGRDGRTACGRPIPKHPGGLSADRGRKVTCLSCLDLKHGILFGRDEVEALRRENERLRAAPIIGPRGMDGSRTGTR